MGAIAHYRPGHEAKGRDREPLKESDVRITRILLVFAMHFKNTPLFLPRMPRILKTPLFLPRMPRIKKNMPMFLTCQVALAIFIKGPGWR